MALAWGTLGALLVALGLFGGLGALSVGLENPRDLIGGLWGLIGGFGTWGPLGAIGALLAVLGNPRDLIGGLWGLIGGLKAWGT